MKIVDLNLVEIDGTYQNEMYLITELIKTIDENIDKTNDIVTNGNIGSILQSYDDVFKSNGNIGNRVPSIEPYTVGLFNNIELKITPLMRYDSNKIYLNNNNKEIVEIISIIDSKNKLGLI